MDGLGVRAGDLMSALGGKRTLDKMRRRHGHDPEGNGLGIRLTTD